MWQTTFAFKKQSSAAELRRYMNRMILEFSRINTLEGVTRDLVTGVFKLDGRLLLVLDVDRALRLPVSAGSEIGG